MHGFDIPELGAPKGGHLHEVITIRNRCGDAVRWERC